MESIAKHFPFVLIYSDIIKGLKKNKTHWQLIHLVLHESRNKLPDGFYL